MNDGWVQTTIGDVAEVVGGGTPRTGVPEYWGGPIPWVTPTEVAAQEGGVVSSTQRTISEAGLAHSSANLLPAGAVLLTSRATVGAVALAGVPMATNQGFASLVAGPGVLPEFLMCWCQLNRPRLLALAVGNTFLEVSKGNVRSLVIKLPPLAEQRRIVDLVANLDAVIQMSNACYAEARRTLRAVEEAFVVTATELSKPLGDVALMRSGPSWSREQEGLTATPTSIPIIGITNTLPDGRLVIGERTYIDGLPASVQLLDSSCLVLIRTNGNRARIGNVYRANPEVEGHAVSAFQIALKPGKADDRDFLFRVLQAPSTQSAISDAASGSTGLGNIAIGWLKAFRVPWPDDGTMAQLADTCERLDVTSDAYRDLVMAAGLARSALLDGMMNGSLRLPETYDRFLEAV